MENIVCDTSALVRLYKGDELNCLIHLFKKIYIPIAVKNECLDEPIIEAIQKHPFEIVEVIKMLDLGKMGAGEREVISLAVEMGVQTILTDDKKAIKRAGQRNLNLDILQSTDILILAKKRGIITSVKKLIDAMIANGEYFNHNAYSEAIKKAGEV
ncbi:MAG: DUF3368 domain-containing protein [Nitrospirae bacterium]|nr:DUF3368 domain-containing protein [Nitrospirota bacterium]